MKITKETTLREMYENDALTNARGNIVSSAGDKWYLSYIDFTLAQVQEKNPTWDCGDMIYGLERLYALAEAGERYAYTISDKTGVQMLRLPAAVKTKEPFALLLAGGAYGAVCTLPESLPVAARLNELGFDCFCLNYRTADESDFAAGLLPKPLEDIADAVRYIQNELGYGGSYFVGGFSAGGHAASLWGTAHVGARHYGLPQPELLMLAYPLISAETFPDSPIRRYMCQGMFGKGYSPEDMRMYDASLHVDPAYPRVYLVNAEDDSTVSQTNADRMRDALGGKIRLERGKTGGHGFGLGSATPLNGWVERAVKYMESI